MVPTPGRYPAKDSETLTLAPARLRTTAAETRAADSKCVGGTGTNYQQEGCRDAPQENSPHYRSLAAPRQGSTAVRRECVTATTVAARHASIPGERWRDGSHTEMASIPASLRWLCRCGSGPGGGARTYSAPTRTADPEELHRTGTGRCRHDRLAAGRKPSPRRVISKNPTALNSRARHRQAEGKLAERLGRHGCAFSLLQDYARNSNQRLNGVTPLHQQHPPPLPPSHTASPAPPRTLATGRPRVRRGGPTCAGGRRVPSLPSPPERRGTAAG